MSRKKANYILEEELKNGKTYYCAVSPKVCDGSCAYASCYNKKGGV